MGRFIQMIFRGFGLALMFAAAIALAWAIYDFITAGQWSPISAGQFWYEQDRGSLNLVQALIQRFLLPEIWDPGIQWVLIQPLWMGCAFFGMMILLIVWFIQHVLPEPKPKD